MFAMFVADSYWTRTQSKKQQDIQIENSIWNFNSRKEGLATLATFKCS